MRFALLISSLVSLASCAPLSTTYDPIDVVIEVRDAGTGEPLSDAELYGGVNAIFNPDSQPGPLGRPGGIPGFVVVNEPSEWVARTDSNGQAAVRLAGGNPTSLTITRPGYLRLRACIETGRSEIIGGSHWRSGPRNPVTGQERPLEFRVVRTATAAD